MKTQLLGTSPLRTTRMAYGCMRIARGWNPAKVTDDDRRAAHAALDAAWDAGFRLFDHADIYCAGMSEDIFGQWLAGHRDRRDAMVLATKCGIRFGGQPTPEAPGRYDFSREWILQSCEGSLKRLGIETIDLYQLHRPDVLMEPDEVAGAFDTLRRQGKVREFGVSNFLPSQVSLLASRLPMRLMVNQVEIHLGRLASFVDGTLDQCIQQRMTPLAWSPVAGGMLAAGGSVKADHPRRAAMLETVKLLDELAEKYSTNRTAMALAWLMRHPSGINPIVGSTNPDHIRQAAQADDVEISREDWYRLYIAARGERMP